MLKPGKTQILPLMKLIKKILWLFLLLLLLATAAGVGYYYAVTKNTALHPEKLELNEKTITLYDKNMHSVRNVSAFAVGETVKITQIPKMTQITFINTEDKRFYTHHGFDIRRIGKAVWNNLKSLSFKEGASTISQQLIKNTHLSQEKTVKRKLKEWKLTKQLEKEYSKEEILEKYLNTIYFGHSCFGLRSASEFYFGKAPDQLTLADSAILAGLVKSPNNYSPFKHPERCLQRKRSVLLLLRKNECITEEELQTALNEPLPVMNERLQGNNGFLHFVFDELSSITEEKNLSLGGNIEIFTELDVELQRKTEEITSGLSDCDKIVLALNPLTGNFKACVSSCGNIRRLPGSLIKPLLVYAPAIEEDILVPATPILDEKINYSGYQPQNYDGKFHGYVSARECVAKSLNIPAVKTLQTLGVQKGASYLKKLNLSIDKEDESLALALGGMKNGFTLQDLTVAYSALKTGTMRDCGFITEIKIDGISVYKRPQIKNQIFSEESAYLMTDMLKSSVKEGTAKKMRALPFDIAAKTGTVGTEKGNTDAYAVSYTEKDLLSVWLGNADNAPIPYTGGTMPCTILAELNEYLYEQYSGCIPNFQKPQAVQSVELDKIAYYDTHNILLADDAAPVEYRFFELFKKTALPTKKSDFFSNPSISSPSIQYVDKQVIITFPKSCPTLYQYKIERRDYATHTTLYEGDFIEEFIDKDIREDKEYVYTVTPYYNKKAGKPITLPAICIKQLKEQEILNKDWWDS